jgi:hypothetical protein
MKGYESDKFFENRTKCRQLGITVTESNWCA